MYHHAWPGYSTFIECAGLKYTEVGYHMKTRFFASKEKNIGARGVA
jgi:hypothetical protein